MLAEDSSSYQRDQAAEWGVVYLCEENLTHWLTNKNSRRKNNPHGRQWNHQLMSAYIVIESWCVNCIVSVVLMFLYHSLEVLFCLFVTESVNLLHIGLQWKAEFTCKYSDWDWQEAIRGSDTGPDMQEKIITDNQVCVGGILEDFNVPN